jgi:hypothetical protein
MLAGEKKGKLDVARMLPHVAPMLHPNATHRLPLEKTALSDWENLPESGQDDEDGSIEFRESFWSAVKALKLSNNDAFMKRSGFWQFRRKNVTSALGNVAEDKVIPYALRFLLSVAAAYQKAGPGQWLFHVDPRTSELHFPLMCGTHFQTNSRAKLEAEREIRFISVAMDKEMRVHKYLDKGKCGCGVVIADPTYQVLSPLTSVGKYFKAVVQKMLQTVEPEVQHMIKPYDVSVETLTQYLLGNGEEDAKVQASDEPLPLVRVGEDQPPTAVYVQQASGSTPVIAPAPKRKKASGKVKITDSNELTAWMERRLATVEDLKLELKQRQENDLVEIGKRHETELAVLKRKHEAESAVVDKIHSESGLMVFEFLKNKVVSVPIAEEIELPCL